MNSVLPPATTGPDFASVFTEVTHTETLGFHTGNEELRLFHLQIRNKAFTYGALQDLLINELGAFVFSKAQIAQYEADGNLHTLGLRASRLLREKHSQDLKDTALGNLLLHVFLKNALGATKLLSKAEIARTGGATPSVSDAVHLIDSDGDKRVRANLVFGASNVVGDFGDAVDQALDRAEQIASNNEVECQLVTQSVLRNHFDPDTTEYLKGLLVPSRSTQPTYDLGFGLFLAYDIGLDPTKYSNDNYPQAVAGKVQDDIRAHGDKIRAEIERRGMSGYPFYVYVLPLNKSEEDRSTIIDGVL